MIYTLERVSGPDLEPLTLAEVRRHLREFDDVTDRDADITALIKAAREWVEDFTGRTLIDTTWQLSISHEAADASSVNEILLRRSPVIAVSAFASVDSAGAETAITAGYELRDGDSKWPRLVGLTGATWSTNNLGTVRITFRAGYADQTGSPQTGAEVVPERFKQAMKLWIQANYEPDEKMGMLLEAAERIIRPEVVDFGFA